MISQACFSLAPKHKRKVIKPRENERRQAQIQPRRKGNILIFAFVFILALSPRSISKLMISLAEIRFQVTPIRSYQKKNFKFSATTIGTRHILLLKSLTEEK